MNLEAVGEGGEGGAGVEEEGEGEIVGSDRGAGHLDVEAERVGGFGEGSDGAVVEGEGGVGDRGEEEEGVERIWGEGGVEGDEGGGEGVVLVEVGTEDLGVDLLETRERGSALL